jgi:hypothetical protein
MVAAVILVALISCERRAKLSREEIPAIKETVIALEKIIKWRDANLFDSVAVSTPAKNAHEVFNFIYRDSLLEFLGFTQKQIIFRNDRARCDCNIHGPEGPIRPVTITLRKEDELWLFKNIEDRVDEIFRNKDSLTR